MRGSIRKWLAPFAARPIALVGLGLLLLVLFAAIFAPWIAPFDPQDMDPMIRLSPPGGVHWFGTDQFGRDTLTRVIYASRMALLVGVGVVLFAMLTGVPIGVFSALFPKVGHVLMRMIDVMTTRRVQR